MHSSTAGRGELAVITGSQRWWSEIKISNDVGLIPVACTGQLQPWEAGEEQDSTLVTNKYPENWSWSHSINFIIAAVASGDILSNPFKINYLPLYFSFNSSACSQTSYFCLKYINKCLSLTAALMPWNKGAVNAQQSWWSAQVLFRVCTFPLLLTCLCWGPKDHQHSLISSSFQPYWKDEGWCCEKSWLFDKAKCDSS